MYAQVKQGQFMDGLSGTKITWYITSHVSQFLGDIIQNKRLDFDEYRTREATLSEAFGLLWQNPTTGVCRGQSGDDSLHATAVACVLLDLYAMRKIEFRKKKYKKGGLLSRWSRFSDEFEEYVVAVIDKRPTYTFLDDCIFKLLLDTDEEYTPTEWMSRTLSYPSHVLMAILRSLVNKGIFVMQREKKEINNFTFPTINQDPQRKLRDEIVMIGLHGHVVDGFMWPLLKLMRGHDRIRASCTTIIERLFDKDDKKGLLNIDRHTFPKVLENNCKKKYRPARKKRSDSFDSLFKD